MRKKKQKYQEIKITRLFYWIENIMKYLITGGAGFRIKTC